MKQRIIKIILLALGLSIGLILIAKIWFDQTYDNFLPNKDNTYLIYLNYSTKEEGTNESMRTPGGIAPGLEQYCPQIKKATRTTPLATDVDLRDENGKVWRISNIDLADSAFFKIMERPTEAGNLSLPLSINNNIVIPLSLAHKIFKNANNSIGKTLVYNNINLQIGGVYKDFPLNSTYKDNPIFLSINSIGQFMWDGSKGWNGNERYLSFIQLNNKDTSSVNRAIKLACKDNLPLDYFKKSEITYTFNIIPLRKINSKFSNINKTTTVLGILAIILLLTSVFNYVLFTLSGIVVKGKSIAVLKCYGASKNDIIFKLLREAFIDLLFALILASFIIIAGNKIAEYLIGTPLSSLINIKIGAILGTICIMLFLTAGLVPAVIYANIPLTSAFKRIKERAKGWKYILLFLQFTLSMLFITLFIVVLLQYSKVTNSSVGYEYQNLVYTSLQNISTQKKESIKNEIKKLSYVSDAGFISLLPFDSSSGNNIILPEDPDEKTLFNVADQYGSSDNFINLMGIKLLEGRMFNDLTPTINEVVVSKSFAEKMAKTAGWEDGCIGKQVIITEHSPNDIAWTICGIYSDYRLGDYLAGTDNRPSVHFSYMNKLAYSEDILLINLKKFNSSNFTDLQKIISNLLPENEIILKSYFTEYINRYAEGKRIKNSVILATIVILIITLIGVIAYSKDEINRRRGEVSIRKINGASLNEILAIILKKVFLIATFAIVIGGIMAFYFSEYFLNLFAIKIALQWYIFAGCGLSTLTIILLVSIIAVWEKANLNPIENLKSE